MGLISLCGMFMGAQFKKAPSGYVYRFNAKGPPIPATQADVDHYVRRGGWSFLFHVAGFMLAVIAASMVVAHWFPGGDETGGLVLMGLLMLGIGTATYISLRHSMRAPERELGGGPVPIMPQRPAGGRRRAKPAKNVSGFVFLGYFIAEMAVGILAAGFLSELLGQWWGEEAAIVGFIVGLIVGAVAIDRICVRHTGESVLDSLPFFP